MRDEALGVAEQAFLQAITRELDEGDLRFPTALEITLGVMRALEDPSCNLARMAAMVSAEPLLAARVVALANTAAYHPGGAPVLEVPRALVCIGFEMLRALALSVSAQQLARQNELGPYQPLVQALWAHGVDVAATARALAHQCTGLSSDAAFLAGIVHDIGQFFLLARVWEYPRLISNEGPLNDLLRVWQAPVGRAVLTAIGMPEALVETVDDPEVYGGSWPPDSLTDLVFIAHLLAPTANPFSLQPEPHRHGLARAATLGLDEVLLARIMKETEEERRGLMELFGIRDSA